MGGLHPQQALFFQRLTSNAERRSLKNVTFLESPPGSTLREELARARFFVFPARNEHFGMTTAEAIASGAIPFVHNSGGQREIVPDPRLRFDDDEFFTKFDCLLEMPIETLSELQVSLSRHVHGYSEEAFIEKMLAFIR
jgi:glycosyltransferase involved in cell wall biosynthesis